MRPTKKTSIALAAALLCAASVADAQAAGTRQTIHVNSDVTTHIVMPENLKMVDISTSKIIGNQCADNMVRIKPAPADSIGERFYNNEFLGTITLIGERHMAQYDIRYDSSPAKAQSIFNVSYDQAQQYTNPDVAMPESEMAKFAWAIYGSKRKFNNIRAKQHGIKAAIYNIYSIGNYFFIDFGLENKTNIAYDIDEIRVTLSDKKEVKSTNSQTIQINPVYILNKANNFNKHYRQVLVLDKLTFPEEKIINIAVSERQISGRTVNLSLEYDDVLNADGFDISKADAVKEIVYLKETTPKQKSRQSQAAPKYDSKIKRLEKENGTLSKNLEEAKAEIKGLKEKNTDLKVALDKMTAAYEGANNTINQILAKDKK